MENGHVVDFDQRTSIPGVYVRIPRPPGLGVRVTDQVYLETVRDYVLGLPLEIVAKRLFKKPETTKKLIASMEWRRVEYMLRDDLKYTAYGRLSKMESSVIDQLEDRIENGDVGYDMAGNEYRPKLSVTKLLAVHKQLTDVRNGIEKNKHNKNQESDDEFDAQRIFKALGREVKRQLNEEKVVETIPFLEADGEPPAPVSP